METIREKRMIPENRQLHIHLNVSDNIPPGEADILIVIVPRKGKDGKEGDLMHLAGCLKNSKTFNQDSLVMQRLLRNEWD